jgi:hypothetical protein
MSRAPCCDARTRAVTNGGDMQAVRAVVESGCVSSSAAFVLACRRLVDGRCLARRLQPEEDAESWMATATSAAASIMICARLGSAPAMARPSPSHNPPLHSLLSAFGSVDSGPRPE